MWTYNSSNGVLSRNGLVSVGYSGFEAGRNNPAMEREPNVGPIPRGKYEIGPLFDSDTHGPACMRLTPYEGTDTFNRSGFLIHGDSILHPGSASHGCVILPRVTRLQIAASGDSQFEVA